MIRKMAYSMGGIATALSFQAFSAYIVFYYVDIKKLSVGLAGIAMLVFALWNAFSYPIFGYLSDSTRSKMGRRIPYLTAAIIPFGLFFALLWMPPFSGIENEIPLFTYLLVMVCLFNAVYSMLVINWSALYPEMFPGAQERGQVNSYRQSYILLGILLGITLPPLLYSRLGWEWMGLVLGASISLLALLALWASREKKQFSAEPPLPILSSLKMTFSSRPFIALASANFLVQFSLIIIFASIPFFSRYILNISPAETSQILATAFMIAVPMLFVWRGLASRLGAKYCFMAATVVLAAGIAPLFTIGNADQASLLAVLIGAGIAGILQTADVMIADVIDDDAIRTGRRREGMFFGSANFINRVATGAEAACMGMIFILSGYSPYVHTQSAGFKHSLRVLIAGLPVVALTLAFVIMIIYPLAGKSLIEMRTRLAEAQEKKGVI